LNIEARSLTIGYRGRHRETVVSERINVRLQPGALVCLLGPNGAGKSTLMRTLAGLQRPLAGSVLLDGTSIHKMASRERARVLSVVLMERITAGALDVYSLVSLGRSPYTDWTGRLTERDHEVIRASLRAVDAETLADRPVIELSDGERQRVILARALAQEPRLMVLDEITAFLDVPHRADIMRLLKRLASHTRVAILLSTHDLELALRTADRIWLLPKGEALQSGSPEDLVLSGAFAHAFRSDGVEFDAMSGVFRLHAEHGGDVELVGESLRAVWTGRALERRGYRVGRTATPGGMKVVVDDADGPWTLLHRGTEYAFSSVDDLVTACVQRTNDVEAV
jgi:iron complex transport system ATP-binding protein